MTWDNVDGNSKWSIPPFSIGHITYTAQYGLELSPKKQIWPKATLLKIILPFHFFMSSIQIFHENRNYHHSCATSKTFVVFPIWTPLLNKCMFSYLFMSNICYILSSHTNSWWFMITQTVVFTILIVWHANITWINCFFHNANIKFTFPRFCGR